MNLIPAVRLMSLLVVTSCSPLAGAATLLTGGQTTLRAEGWEVTRNERGGQVRCTTTLATDHGAELDADGLHVKLAESPQWVAWQFDDGPWLPRRTASPMEQRLREAVLGGSELEQARKARQVRLQTSSLKRGIDTQRLDLAGLDAVEAHLRAGCPRPAIATAATPAVVQTAPAHPGGTPVATTAVAVSAGAVTAPAGAQPAAAADLCGEALKTRLRSVGVSLAQISQACRP